MPRSPRHKLTVHVPVDLVEQLRELAREHDTSLTDVLIGHLKLGGKVATALSLGAEVSLKYPDGRTSQVLYHQSPTVIEVFAHEGQVKK